MERGKGRCDHGGGTTLSAVGPSRLLARALFLMLLRRTGPPSVRGAEGGWGRCHPAALVHHYPQAGASCLCRTPMDPRRMYAISFILVSIFLSGHMSINIKFSRLRCFRKSSCGGSCVLPFSACLPGDALPRVTILSLFRLGGYR